MLVQFRTYGKVFALTSGRGLTNGDETFLISCKIRWITPSGTNESGQGWGVGRDVEMREILVAIPIRTSSVEGEHRELCGWTPPDALLK